VGKYRFLNNMTLLGYGRVFHAMTEFESVALMVPDSCIRLNTVPSINNSEWPCEAHSDSSLKAF
jgi:hypothetical protein